MKQAWTILAAAWLGLAMTTAWADPPAAAEDPQPAEERAADQPPPQDQAGEQLSHAQERELLQVIHRRVPHRYEQLTELRENNPDRYRQVMARWYRRYEQWQAMGTPEDAGQSCTSISSLVSPYPLGYCCQKSRTATKADAVLPHKLAQPGLFSPAP